MASWSDPPEDVLILIAQRLKKLEHFVAFGAVCKSWRSAAKKEYFKGLWLRQHTPYLMLPVRDGKEDTRELYSLYDGQIVASVTTPNFRKTQCLESLGWLLVIEENRNMCLFDPFSNVEIIVPPQNTFPGFGVLELELEPHVYVHKLVLSSSPSETSDFIVMIICGTPSSLGFWRPGDESWNKIDLRMGAFSDVTYHNGHFYAVDFAGYVWVFKLDLDIEGNNRKVEGRILTRLIDDGFNYMNKFPSELRKRTDVMNNLVVGSTLYILGSDQGSLLLIVRASEEWNEKEDMPYKDTTEFHVYEVDVQTGLWKEIHSLGNTAIFIGHNSTVSVDASRFPAFFKANHIYFTDDGWECYFFYGEKEAGKDMGVYNLETGKIEQFFQGDLVLSKISPSMWITPCF